MSHIDGFWIGSTNDIYRDEDQTTNLTNELEDIEASIKGCLKWANKQYDLTDNYGTYQVSTTDSFTDGNTYLVSVIYTNDNNTLVDRSLYVMRYTETKGIIPTVTLCGCANGNDSFVAVQSGTSVGLSSQYTGSGATKCTVKII